MDEDVLESLYECLEEHYKLFPPKGSSSGRGKLAQSVQDPRRVMDDEDALMLMARDIRRAGAGQGGYYASP